MPLFAVDGTKMTTVPHGPIFRGLVKKLGTKRTSEVRAFLNKVVEEMKVDNKTNLRTFSSSHLGASLSPWPPHLYELARELCGASADEKTVQDRAALIFGQFVWECIMNRNENWTFYDPNLSSRDPNRELMGKVYFEQG